MAKNPEAKITVKMFTDDFKRGANELKNESSTLSREFKLQSEQMKLTATETEKLEAKITYLSQRQDIARRSVEQSQQAYNESVRLFGENSRAAQEMARNLDNARIDEQRLSNEIELANRSLQEQRRVSGQTDNAIDELGDSLDDTARSAKELGDSLTDAGSKMTVGLSIPIAAAGGAAIASAIQFENASARIQTSLGTTAEAADKLQATAKNIWKDGFGENLDEVSEALIRVKQNMKNVSDGAELEKVTRDTMLLAKTFDADLNEITRAGNNLITNFGITSEKAFDLMAKGAQNGLNFSDELFDNLAEYAPLWANMGYSAEEMFGIMERGAKKGVYNLDYVNDVMKELQIRLQDGSKATSDAMNGMLADTQEMFDAFNAGEVTVAEMSQQIAKDLSSLDNQVDRNVLGVGLFGTKWEDLGGDVVLSMLASNEAMTDFEGTMNGIAGVQENTFGQRWNSMLRNAASSLEPVGMILLDLAEQWLPKIIAVIEILATWFANLSPVIQIVVVAFGAILAAIGPLLVIIGSIVSALGNIIPLFASGGLAATAFGAVMTALTGPIGIIIAAITGIVAVLVLMYNKVEWFRDGVNIAWEQIKAFTVVAFEFIKNLITTIMTAIVTFGKSQLDKFRAFWDENGKAIMALVKFHFDMVKSNIEMVMGIIKGIFQVVWPLISSTVRYAWENIKLIVSTAINIVLGVIQTVLKLLQGDWKGAWDTILKTVKNIWGDVEKFLKGIDLKQTGKDIIQGLVNGIASMTTAVWDKVKSITDGIKNAITGALDIHSPSRVTRGYGVNVGEGFVLGMDDKLRSIVAAGKRLANAVGKPMNDFNLNDGQSTGILEQQQTRLAKVSDAIVPLQPIYIQVVSELDGQAVANNQYQYLNGMTTSDYNIGRTVRGY